MDGGREIRIRSFNFVRYAWSLAISWTVAVALLVIWSSYQHKSMSTEMMRAQALVAYSKDVIYRNWNARHDRVYVPVTPETPPNPYLKVDDRDVVTQSGVRLTLMNPAYMMRLANESGLNNPGISSHITSLNPIRPENAPDSWEAESLRTFEQGGTETSSIRKIGSDTYMRFMRPLVVEENCLKCHAHQGYKVGDVRGGISVTVPAQTTMMHAHTHEAVMAAGYGLLWILGLAGIVLGTQRLERKTGNSVGPCKNLRYRPSNGGTPSIQSQTAYVCWTRKAKS